MAQRFSNNYFGLHALTGCVVVDGYGKLRQKTGGAQNRNRGFSLTRFFDADENLIDKWRSSQNSTLRSPEYRERGENCELLILNYPGEGFPTPLA